MQDSLPDSPNSLNSIYALPINTRKDDILESVDKNQVTIITAETGAGKSTQVPQFLAEHGYHKIIVTQPRILAARNLCNRVRQEYSWRTQQDCSALVGYRTAHEQDDGPTNVILYCTDGLQLVRELTGSGTHERQILILDEIHEWNENMEVLIAWAKKRCLEEPEFKIVLMSATIEAASLAEYFGAPTPLSISGRSFPVEHRHSGDLFGEISQQLERRGSNILVFLPGKAEIEQIAETFSRTSGNRPIIPLHSQLELEDQQKAFVHYPSGKLVLTTNIAQTSVTIDDIDVVIDSGLERRAEVRSGVEGLFMAEISRADCLQRAGRAGRTKQGLYILARYNRLPCSLIDERPAYGIPEIMRKHIDRLVLRLANIDIDIENLDFFHAPSKNTIKQAKRTLALLGALQDGSVTALGHRMERFPVESTYSRMLVESEKYSEAIQTKLAAIISLQEVGGIVKGGPRHGGWKRFTQQNSSDLIAQYDVLRALPTIPDEDYEELGIIAKNIDKAREVYERLCRDLGLELADVPQPVMADEIEPLLKCIVAGLVHQIWVLDDNGEAVHVASGKRRELSSSTVVRRTGLFVGTPFDLEISTGSGLETLHLVNDITAIDPLWLDELAPGLFKVEYGKTYYDNYLGTLATRVQLKFRGRRIETGPTSILERTADHQKLFVKLFAAWAYQQLETERRGLQSKYFQQIPAIRQDKVENKARRYADGAMSVAELPKQVRYEMQSLAKLQTWIDKALYESILSSHTSGTRAGNHHSHHARKPEHRTKDRWRNR